MGDIKGNAEIIYLSAQKAFCAGDSLLITPELSLTGYPPDDFMLLLEADALIMAHSSFSWLAAFFNENEKYIRRGFRHLLPYDVHEFNDVIAFKYSYLHAAIAPIQKVYFKIKNKIKVLSGGNQC